MKQYYPRCFVRVHCRFVTNSGPELEFGCRFYLISLCEKLYEAWLIYIWVKQLNTH